MGNSDKDEGFKEYKHLILNNLDQFKSCREHHASEFQQVHSEINTMRREILKEAKEIVVAINKMDRRLVMVEVKSGVWGILGGALAGLAPFAIYYFTKQA